MKIVRQSERKEYQNSKTCKAFEYPLGDSDINGALIEIVGRYPEKGWAVNTKCKEMAYIIKGCGQLFLFDRDFSLDSGDLILIEPGEKYYFEGTITMFVPRTPAWYPEQHKLVE